MRKYLTLFLLLFLIVGCNQSKVQEETKEQPKPTTEEIKQQKINNIMKDMSIEEKVGQLFFVRMPTTNTKEDIEKYHLGGMVAFGANLENETKETIKQKNKEYQSTSKIPLLIGIDEEGGTVSRLSYANIIKPAFKSPQTLYKEGKLEAIKKDSINKSKILKELGFNINLAPVVDVATDKNAFIYDRTIGKNAKETSKYAKTVVESMKKSQIGSTLKHFPGYGNNKDSHINIVHDKRKLQTLKNNDFLPFQAGIKAGANSILISHNIIESIDKKQPASISKKVIDVIRKDLNFDKVLMTDDMDMAGLSDFTSQNKAAFKAIQAGNDLVMSSHYQEQIPYILKQIKNNKIKTSRIDQSVKRILTMKYDLGLLN